MKLKLDYLKLKSTVLNNGTSVCSAGSDGAASCFCIKGAIINSQKNEDLSEYNGSINYNLINAYDALIGIPNELNENLVGIVDVYILGKDYSTKAVPKWRKKMKEAIELMDDYEIKLIKGSVFHPQFNQKQRQELLWDLVARLEELNAIEWINKPINEPAKAPVEPEKVVETVAVGV